MGTEVKSPLFFYKYFFIIFYAQSKWDRKDPFGLKSRPQIIPSKTLSTSPIFFALEKTDPQEPNQQAQAK
jgi:hypothetical protein